MVYWIIILKSCSVHFPISYNISKLINIIMHTYNLISLTFRTKCVSMYHPINYHESPVSERRDSYTDTYCSNCLTKLEGAFNITATTSHQYIFTLPMVNFHNNTPNPYNYTIVEITFKLQNIQWCYIFMSSENLWRKKKKTPISEEKRKRNQQGNKRVRDNLI